MKQVDIIAHLAEAAKAANALVVSEIGSQTQWLYSTGDDERYLYLSGPMGMGPSVALGVALAQPERPVLCLVGDGALVMNLNALATLSHLAPPNLTVAVMDNGVYDLTGQLETPSAGLDYEQLVQGFPGFSAFQSIDLTTNLELTAQGGLTFWHARVEPSKERAPRFPLTPDFIHRRFKEHLGLD